MRLKRETSKRNKYTFLLLVLLLLISCEKEKPATREYPRLRGTIITNISEDGATFTADLYSFGTEAIEEYGFLWDFGGELFYNSSSKVILGIPQKEGVFSTDIRSGLISERDYTVRPFVKTESRVVYGPLAYFKSLGCNGPIISGFYPKSALWGDTIKISGKYFAWAADQNLIKLNQEPCDVIRSNDTTIYFQLSSKVSTLKNIISLDISGNTSEFNMDTLRLLPPEINRCNPGTGSWNQVITLEGRFNTILSRNSVFFNNEPAEITYLSGTEMMVKVPNQLSETRAVIKYLAEPFTVMLKDTFKILPPTINSFYPLAGPTGALVTISGRFTSSSCSVMFGTLPAEIVSLNDSVITTTVPEGLAGQTDINLSIFSTIVSSPNTFTVTEPKITTVFPLSGTFKDEIKISGENFISSGINTSVTFDGIPAVIKSATETDIIAFVPLSCDSIPRSINLEVGFTSLISVDKFILTPPEVYDISPREQSSIQDIIITGNNFNPSISENSVFWNGIQLIVKEAEKEKITATLPNINAARASARIVVNSGGYTRYSTDYFEFKSQWLHINAPATMAWTPGKTVGSRGISFAVDGKGYMIDYKTGKMTSFDPITYTFSEIGYYKQFHTYQSFASVIHKDTCLIIGPNGTFRFNSSDNTFSKMCGPPPTCLPNKLAGAAFSIKDKLYYGLTGTLSRGLSVQFSVYDSHNNSWSFLAPFPFSMNAYVVSSFSTNDKGYVLLSNKVFYEYNPQTNKWTQLSPLPSSSNMKGVSTWLIDGKILIGAGQGDKYKDILLQYNLANNRWLACSFLPGEGMWNTSFFSINNKGYIGLGLNSNNEICRDFYEYDPDHSLK